MKKTILKITGEGADIQIDGWNKLKEKEQKNYLMRLFKKSLPAALRIINETETVHINDIPKYEIEVKKGWFGNREINMDISLLGLEWVRLHLCGCDGCTEIIATLMEVQEKCEK